LPRTPQATHLKAYRACNDVGNTNLWIYAVTTKELYTLSATQLAKGHFKYRMQITVILARVGLMKKVKKGCYFGHLCLTQNVKKGCYFEYLCLTKNV
jgi:hypothetical protein